MVQDNATVNSSPDGEALSGRAPDGGAQDAGGPANGASNDGAPSDETSSPHAMVSPLYRLRLGGLTTIASVPGVLLLRDGMVSWTEDSGEAFRCPCAEVEAGLDPGGAALRLVVANIHYHLAGYGGSSVRKMSPRLIRTLVTQSALIAGGDAPPGLAGIEESSGPAVAGRSLGAAGRLGAVGAVALIRNSSSGSQLLHHWIKVLLANGVTPRPMGTRPA